MRHSPEALRTAAAVALAGLGVAQMTGDLLDVPALRGLAAATVASPAPRVFSSVRGLETFSSRFAVAWTDPEGRERRKWITPELSAQIRGPYNRRNVYGALIAFGPILVTDEATRPMFEGAARYAMCGDAPLLREIGIEPDDVVGDLRVIVVPKPGTRPHELALELVPSCDR